MPRSLVSQRNRPHLLIVEDDDVQTQVLATALATEGYEVDSVGGGLAAVWKVREGHYDLVLVDYQLPDIDGRAAAMLVGNFMGQAARPMLIALTSTPEQLRVRERGADKAFDLVLAKSSGIAPLLFVIRQCLAMAPDDAVRRRAEDALLLRDWLDYDAAPYRVAGDNDDPGPARILVVEDDQCQQLLLASVLEQQGHVVDTTSNGLDAVCKIREGCYDLALVDYDLPEMDGLAAGKLVRDLMQEAMRPRLIAITATPDRLRDKEGMVPSVFDEIVSKSSDFQGLLWLVDRQMRASSNPATRRAAEYSRVQAASR